MAMAAQIDADIEANMRYFNSMRGNVRHFNEGVAARTSRLKGLIKGNQLDPSEAADVVNKLRSIGWPMPQQDELIEAIHAKLMDISQSVHDDATNPHIQQDFESLHNFLTETILKSDQLEHDLYMLASSLALIRANENSMATLTAIRLALDTGIAPALAMAPLCMYDELQKTKKDYKRYVPQIDANDFIRVLPKTPHLLKWAWPDVYDAAYAVEGPVPFPIDAFSFARLVGMIPRRKTHSGLQAARPHALPSQSTPIEIMQPDITSVFQMFGQMMSFMQQGQASPQGGQLPNLTFTDRGHGAQRPRALGDVDPARPHGDASAQPGAHPAVQPRLSAPAPPASPLSALATPMASKPPVVDVPGAAAAEGSGSPLLPTHEPRKTTHEPRKSVTECTQDLLQGLKKKARKRACLNDNASSGDEGDSDTDRRTPASKKAKPGKRKAAAEKSCPPSSKKLAKKSTVMAGQKHKAAFERSIQRVRIRCIDGTSFSIKFSDHGNDAEKAMAAAKKWIKDHS